MSKIKSSTLRNISDVRASSTSSDLRAIPRPPVTARPMLEDRERSRDGLDVADTTAVLIAEFVAPPHRTMARLNDPRLFATLQAASDTLAPSGISEDPTDRYAASVIETHLVARRRLSKLTNSLLKT